MLTTRPLSWTCCSIAFLAAAFCARPGTLYAKAPAETLQLLRTKAAENEKAASLIKLKYSVKYDRHVPPKPMQGMRVMVGKPYVRAEGDWAQDGPQLQFIDRDFYEEGSDRPAGGGVNVLNKNLTKEILRRSLQGGLADSDRFLWSSCLDLAHLGIRPFEAERLLSEVLVPEAARVRPDTEEEDGRTAYVVDVKRPAEPVYYQRFWIDAERGMPLKFHSFSGPPDAEGTQLLATVESIKLHRLPGGGWFPVSGVRKIVGPDGPTVTQRIDVDVATITTRREDIPASLFDLTFPEGVKVRDARGEKVKGS